jgi:Tol biopolymer transport system component
MATVWLARDLKHDRPVALKVLHPTLSATLGPERFLREIKLAARLHHPHIVPVYDSGESDTPIAGAGRLWYAMPYVDGETLRDRLRREGTLAPAQAVRIAREAAQALGYAHAQGVVHRDIKPENILLARDGSTLVADFGIARPLGFDADPGLTAAGLIVGTPTYMSPEQAGGARDLGPESDLYSLGCVLYEMLTGRPPYAGATGQALMAQHIGAPVPTPDPRTPGMPTGVSRAVVRALAKAPADRFGSAAEFADALREAVTPGAPGSRRALLAAALGALVLAGTLLATRSSPERGGASRGSGPGEAVASGFSRKLSQITFGQGVEEWPAWSPDGRRLAYVGESDGFHHVFVRDLATGAERRVTTDPRDHIQPAWTPDGNRLAYVRARAARGRLEPNDLDGWYNEQGDIWSVDLPSGEQRAIVEDAFGPSFSPDGRSLAFDAQWAGPRRIWVADAGGRSPRQVSADSSDAVVHVQPRWSPDGGRLAFRRVEKTVSDVAVVSLAGGGMTRVTDDNVLDTDPSWSPAGRHIYFSSSRGGGLNVWRVPVEAGGRPTGPPEQLTTGAGNDVQVAVAPGTGRLAFAVRGINADLWRLPVTPATGRPTGPPEPVLATTRVESRGAWSPDGRRIAFNSDRQGEMNIWVRSLDDGTDRRVTEGSGGDYQPSWSPDGTRLAFFSARGGNTDVWSVEVASGALVRLTDDPALDTNPFYSPDGSRIGFVSDRSGGSEVWVMNADGSGQRQVSSVGVWGHFLRWTADGGGIVFRGEGAQEIRIYRVAVSDGGLTRLPEVASGGHMSFSPSQALLMDVRSHKALWIYPVNGGPAYEGYRFEDAEVRIDYPVWSPDGRAVLFDRAAPPGGDLWLLEGVE